MINKKLAFILLSFSSVPCLAAMEGTPNFQSSFYVAAIGGYGSTTWKGLVPSIENQNMAVNLSTPIAVREGGTVFGVSIGYEFIPQFAVEGSYMHYPDAKIMFDPISIFSFGNDELTQFISHTEVINLMGKIFLPIPNTPLRLFSSIGAANLHRRDMLNNDWLISPTFGAGLNYHVTNHLMGELVGNYTAGYGESQLNPTMVYFPFLYSFSFRLAYCF